MEGYAHWVNDNDTSVICLHCGAIVSLHYWELHKHWHKTQEGTK